MVRLTVNLMPPLTGVQGKLYLVVGEEIYPIIDLPLSQNGIISVSIAVSSPELDYAVIFPAQTIEGVTYAEVMSPLFNLILDVTLDMTLTGPEPPPAPMNIGVLVAVAAGLYLLFGKK